MAHLYVTLMFVVNKFITPDINGLNMAGRFMASRSDSIMVTNIGAINPPRNENVARIKSLSFAVGTIVPVPFIVTACSWAGKLFINLIFDETKISLEQAEEIVKDMEQRLLIHYNHGKIFT